MHRIKRIRKRRIIRLTIQLFAWVGVALLYYFGFSLLFDTPAEHRMRLSTDKLREEYEAMSQRYDSLEMILDNITARDQSVFRSLFEANPYDMESEQSEDRLALYEQNITKSKRELAADLKNEIDVMQKKAADLEA
ncbi:MAG: M23 family peptidase, partial [Alistipes sp.]|nr:M23 family peptidase [Alistipes sp.]